MYSYEERMKPVKLYVKSNHSDQHHKKARLPRDLNFLCGIRNILRQEFYIEALGSKQSTQRKNTKIKGLSQFIAR